MILASAGAAGVATGSFELLLVLAMPEMGEIQNLIAISSSALIASLVIALITWVAMKVGGWLPRAGELQDPGSGQRPG